MQAKLVVNDLDISRMLAEGGLVQGEEYRQLKSVTTLDGTIHEASIVKRTLTANLQTITDAKWKEVAAALAARPLTVTYTDDTAGDRTAQFYVTSRTATAKKVMAGVTWVSGASFALKER